MCSSKVQQPQRFEGVAVHRNEPSGLQFGLQFAVVRLGSSWDTHLA
jgi:hypothetical protein